MLALCPRLRVLGLRFCTGISRVVVTPAMGLTSLRSVTILDCSSLIGVDFTVVSSLRSFRYSDGFFFCLPVDALFADLDIRFGVQKSRNVLICQKVFSDWFETRVCSKLATLTICSNVLFVVSSLLNATSHAESTKMVGDLFPRMTELQLIMLEMKAPELANIYVFLKNSRCSSLERLFVQLPTAPSGLFVDSFDYVGLEPPPDVLENLKVVKIMNFSWNRFELQLVCFLLTKASSLRKLLLINASLVPLHVPSVHKGFFVQKDHLPTRIARKDYLYGSAAVGIDEVATSSIRGVPTTTYADDCRRHRCHVTDLRCAGHLPLASSMPTALTSA
ncbi:hypothetical protein VPH35_126460 [Triticum aestivum]